MNCPNRSSRCTDQPMISWSSTRAPPLRAPLCLSRTRGAHPPLRDRRSAYPWAPGAVVLPVPGVTEGAACTALTAGPFIDNQDALLIANSDQWWIATSTTSCPRWIRAKRRLHNDHEANDTKWSYVELDAQGLVRPVVEKVVVSDEATVGSTPTGTVRFRAHCAPDDAENLRVNGEFYVAPAYDGDDRRGQSGRIFNVGRFGRWHVCLGNRPDLVRFRGHEASRPCRETG